MQRPRGRPTTGPWASWTRCAQSRPAGASSCSPARGDDQWLYGRGVACLLQGISNGAEGVDVVGASVQVSQDGSALVSVGLADMGQGARTVCTQIVSEILGISLSKITAGQVDTDLVHDSGPTVASRNTTVGGMAVQMAAAEVKKSLVVHGRPDVQGRGIAGPFAATISRFFRSTGMPAFH